MSCDLDPINMVCWAHGVDITERDYIEGVCGVGYFEREECELDGNEFEDDIDQSQP